MIYKIVNMSIYIISVALAMIALSCFNFDHWIKKGKVREFYLFYIMACLALAYLFASFILNFGTWSFYS